MGHPAFLYIVVQVDGEPGFPIASNDLQTIHAASMPRAKMPCGPHNMNSRGYNSDGTLALPFRVEIFCSNRHAGLRCATFGRMGKLGVAKVRGVPFWLDDRMRMDDRGGSNVKCPEHVATRHPKRNAFIRIWNRLQLNTGGCLFRGTECACSGNIFCLDN